DATRSEKRALQDTQKYDDNRSSRKIALDYGDMAKEAFITQDSWLRSLAVPAKFAVNFCLFLLQLGICSVFYIFVSEHIKEIIDFFFGTELSLKLIFVIIMPFFIMLTTVQNVFLMSCISLIGNVLVTIALAIVLVESDNGCLMPHFIQALPTKISQIGFLSTTWHAWINLVKAMAGVGIFALPVAFQKAGLWVGTILTITLGFANAHTMIKLVKCSQYLSKV
ncbi:hypothetical protein TELCIR_13774, partial [Teladorsagia circumcincta]